jgi:hypothetical protein
MENDVTHNSTSLLEIGDGCPYCAHLFETDLEIINCYLCQRMGCADCVAAGACCLEDGEIQ